jgi:hypothetical protein
MDYIEKSFASATETTKLLITLATALIAFCVGVVNVKSGDATLLTPLPGLARWFLAACWLLLLLSVGSGVWTQLSITGELADAKPTGEPPSAWSKAITLPFRIQILTFLAGVVALTVYGFLRLAG